MRRPLVTCASLLVAAVTIGACGGGSDAPDTSSVPMTSAAHAAVSDFPRPAGRDLAAMHEGMQQGLVLAPSVSVLVPGRNRYGFALFDAARKQVGGAPVAVYVSKTNGSAVRGPFLARTESLAVKPQFQSTTTNDDPQSAKSVYVVYLSFPRPGRYRISAVAQLDGRPVSTSSFTAVVVAKGAPGTPPVVGARAPKVSTPTLNDVAGDAARITTRVPPAEGLISTDLADVYGKKPVALLFATPALCQSRVCGPVEDILEEVRAGDTTGDVAYIANEIYRDNRPDQGLRPQPAAYRIPTEPWLFMLDRHGRVVERIEGAFSVRELKAAVARARTAR